MGQIDPKWDNSDTFSDQISEHFGGVVTFSDQISVILAHKFSEILYGKVPDLFVPFGANLTRYGPKSDSRGPPGDIDFYILVTRVTNDLIRLSLDDAI